MPYEISSLQKNAAPDEAVQSRGYIERCIMTIQEVSEMRNLK